MHAGSPAIVVCSAGSSSAAACLGAWRRRLWWTRRLDCGRMPWAGRFRALGCPPFWAIHSVFQKPFPHHSVSIIQRSNRARSRPNVTQHSTDHAGRQSPPLAHRDEDLKTHVAAALASTTGLRLVWVADEAVKRDTTSCRKHHCCCRARVRR